jgi:hypothetical protein
VKRGLELLFLSEGKLKEGLLFSICPKVNFRPNAIKHINKKEVDLSLQSMDMKQNR